ncbi:hypothetical protein FBY03_105154 [Pseudomonas sp. SJZ079]|uniref:DUF5666 domain-containing protein n=1 Tax=Pseudomonas sp. SJZ079 TaxID=2572887 RepID=UPI00119C1298|nr:DUF5666 domain-containing protein [Pseudomonas sp. SJZ079]TWC39025.1 hypothetical protein FBY03_105154 [Pseudomonas sp. SJZ079]
MSTASRLLCIFAFICGPFLLASSLSAAPVCLEPGGMGGTGAVATGGIGGTGAPADNGGVGGTGAADGGGVGGTGAADDGGMGGTGIVGTITGFASICVNGVEVHFDSEVSLSENGVPASSNQLAIGQVVAVEARTSSRGLEARSIAILHAYEGPITDVASGFASLRVMGQSVRVAPSARVAEGLRIGESVRVSGLRNARGEVIASRIDRAPNLAQVSAIGAIARTGDLQGLVLSKPLAPSSEVLVSGTWDGRQLNVVQTRSDPGMPFAGRVRNALVEGLVRGQQGDRIEFGGFTAYVDRSTSYSGGQAADLTLDQRIRVTGVFGKGREIRAERIEFTREQPATSSQQGSGQHGSSTTETEQHESKGSDQDDNESRERSDDGETRERVERSDDDETRERIERRVESPSGDLERRERIEVRDSGGRLETRERIEIFENGVRVERIERIERLDRVDKPERVERVERVDRPERVERPDKVDRSGPN